MSDASGSQPLRQVIGLLWPIPRSSKAHNVIALKNISVNDILGAKGVVSTANTRTAWVYTTRADTIVLIGISLSNNCNIK